MANDNITIKIDDRRFLRAMRALEKFDETHEKQLRKILRDSVKIAADKINQTIYQSGIKRDTGRLSKAMGVGTFKSESKGYIGGKSRPKRASSQNGGWRIHFFASPAVQMKNNKRFDFQKKYNTVSSKIRSKFIKDFNKLIDEVLK